jgi:hypothetical protein
MAPLTSWYPLAALVGATAEGFTPLPGVLCVHLPGESTPSGPSVPSEVGSNWPLGLLRGEMIDCYPFQNVIQDDLWNIQVRVKQYNPPALCVNDHGMALEKQIREQT